MNTPDSTSTDCTCFSGSYHYFPLSEMDTWCGHFPRCAHCGAESARNSLSDQTTIEWLCDPCLTAHSRSYTRLHANARDCVQLLESSPECLARDTPTYPIPTPAVETSSLGPRPDCPSFAGPEHVFPVSEKSSWCGHRPPCGHSA